MSASTDPPGRTRWQVGARAPEPPRLRPESEVVDRWVGDQPVVSVLCATYQHVDFIEDALRGFLGQDTTFPFEVIVRDDASTDGTAEIVADFADRYPNVVRAVLEPENRWRQGGPRLRTMARGAFIARCEGDDYWVDPTKLQTQVETLERHRDAVLSHHQAIVIEDGVVVEEHKLPEKYRRDFSQLDLMRATWALTLSLLFRNVEREDYPPRSQILNGDKFLLAQLGEHGGAIWEPDLLPAVYRRHAGGVWSTLNRTQRGIDHARSYFWIGQYFLDRHREVAQDHLATGLAHYARACSDSGVDVGSLFARNDKLVREALRLPNGDMPASLRDLIAQRDAAVEERDELRDRVERRDERLKRLSEERDRLRHRLDVVTTEHTHLVKMQEQLTRKLAATRQARHELQERFDRLRGRFVVRCALAVARPARPLFTLWRRVRAWRPSATLDGQRGE